MHGADGSEDGSPLSSPVLDIPPKTHAAIRSYVPHLPHPSPKATSQPPTYQRSEQFLQHKGSGTHLELGKRDAPGAEEAGEVGL